MHRTATTASSGGSSTWRASLPAGRSVFRVDASTRSGLWRFAGRVLRLQGKSHYAGGLVIGVIVPVHGFAPYLAETLDCVLAQEALASGSRSSWSTTPRRCRWCCIRTTRRTAGWCGARSAAGPPPRARRGLSALGVLRSRSSRSATPTTPGCPASSLCRWRRSTSAPDAVACFGRALIVGADGRATGERWAELRPGLHAGDELTTLLYEANPIPTSSMVLRRSALECGRRLHLPRASRRGLGPLAAAGRRAAEPSSAWRRRSCATAATPAA